MEQMCRFKLIKTMKNSFIWLAFFLTTAVAAFGAERKSTAGLASWYGEEHRGKLMANGQRFNPDRMTAASWFYPLGTQVRVTVLEPAAAPKARPPRSVTVTITDRGPNKRLVRNGRTIDLAHAAFKKLAHPDLGLVLVVVLPEMPRRL